MNDEDCSQNDMNCQYDENTQAQNDVTCQYDENSQDLIEQSNSLQELLKENSFFKEHLNQSVIDYEEMKAEYEGKLAEKDEIIKSLREHNPLVLAQSRTKTYIYSRC